MVGHRNATRRARPAGLLAGAAALLLQLVAWAWMPVWMAPSTADAAEIVICTPDGFRSVALDGRKAPHDPTDSGTGRAAPSCSLCPLAGALAVAAPAALSVPADPVSCGTGERGGEPVATGRFLFTLRARAPPATA
ncbi:DUF2946 family protein [Azospirillum agricola]|uniref:DUF2946 family protein n=1 Tax=Azospirillum agricola TaxID=1720247 RepID=UPI000A0EFF9C|nr:DUF2946 family protein [Azospirillum agricola]MBP2230589.1 hypothetical protein [Azospirillum agricola]SMH52278.1 hypothetical protein SAMN02982994_3088 [Azospirillum lipoferum]